MKLIQIQYFLTVAECKSVTKAAERLFVSQPAVTKQMNLLEEELGVRLMARTPHGIELTGVGAEFEKDCRKVMEDLDLAVSKVVNAGRKSQEVLRIGCFDGAVIEDFLPELYEYFRKTAPDMELTIGRHSFAENRKALQEGSIDMLIELQLPGVSKDPFLDDCEVRVLSTRIGALIYSKYSPLAKKADLTPADFQNESFYTSSKNDAEIMQAAGRYTLKKIGIPNPRVVETENFTSLLSNVRLGMGYTVLAKMAADTHPDLLAYELPAEFGMRVIAVWKQENTQVRKRMKNYKK